MFTVSFISKSCYFYLGIMGNDSESGQGLIIQERKSKSLLHGIVHTRKEKQIFITRNCAYITSINLLQGIQTYRNAGTVSVQRQFGCNATNNKELSFREKSRT